MLGCLKMSLKLIWENFEKLEERSTVIEASKSKEEAGSGRAQGFWDFCEETTRDYLPLILLSHLLLFSLDHLTLYLLGCQE